MNVKVITMWESHLKVPRLDQSARSRDLVRRDTPTQVSDRRGIPKRLCACPAQPFRPTQGHQSGRHSSVFARVRKRRDQTQRGVKLADFNVSNQQRYIHSGRRMGNKVSLENELINLRLTSKQQQRGALKCTKNENAAKAKLREAIKAGNIEGARIYGQNAIREKNQALNCLRLSSRIDAVASRLETAIRMKQVTSASPLLLLVLLPYQYSIVRRNVRLHYSCRREVRSHTRKMPSSSTCAQQSS